MGRKCSVVNCRSGYNPPIHGTGRPTVKPSIFRFPKNVEECRLWISCLPNQLQKVTNNMGICSLHWPTNTPMVRKNRGRYPVPTVPPSLFPNVPASSIPSHSSRTQRSTKNALSCARNPVYDEMTQFRQVDRLNSETFVNDFSSRFSSFGLIYFCDDYVALVSNERAGSVHKFSIYLNLPAKGPQKSRAAFSVNVEIYYNHKQIQHPSIKGSVNCWSGLEEIIRFVISFIPGDDLKHDFVTQALNKLNAPKNKRMYSLEDLTLAFSWYARSRALYQELRAYIHLPSLSTLRKLTRVAKNTDDKVIFTSVFKQLDERSRGCIIIIDEIYVKASITYRGGTLFGYSVDHPGKVATTFLCVMVKCFFGSKSFLCRLIPCHALKADFQFKVICNVLSMLEECGARVLALLCDNNRMNQRFFSLFQARDPSQPWIVKSPTSPDVPLFLIYDPVHIMKNIRNSWLTERQKVLFFKHEDDDKIARWSDLISLYDHESNHMNMKMSSLTKSAIQPNNVEKQKVSLALQVFSEKTSAALKASTMSTESCQQTALFLDKVVKFWKVLNCKTPYQSICQRDPDRAVIDLSEKGQNQLDVLRSWIAFAKQLEPN